MRGIHRIALSLLAAGLALSMLSCAGTDIDSGDSADVVLLVSQIPQIPAITTAFDATLGVCTFTVVPVSVSLENRPKNAAAGAGRPYNDIMLEFVTLSYVWDEPSLTTPIRTFDIGGTIPVGSTVSVSFPPIALGDLQSGYAGHTATGVTMQFFGRTVSGQGVSTIARGGSVSVNSCPSCQDSDADGVCDSTDNCLNAPNVDQANADGDSLGDVCDPCPADPNPLCVTP